MKHNTKFAFCVSAAITRAASTQFHIETPRLLVLLSLTLAAAPLAHAQSSWTGANYATDINWSDSGNWSGGAPGTTSAVTFPDGPYPVTTNVQGAVNNIVPASTVIASLAYSMNPADFVTTQIPGGVTLTVNGNLTCGPGAEATVATITGGGSLIAGTGTSTLQVTSSSGTATLDLSALSNFVFNAGGTGGTINISTSAGGGGKVNLAGASNNITAATLNIANNNTGNTGVLNLGNGTNIINADTINMGISKGNGTMQFLNNAGGVLMIANHTGTGRATIVLGGEASSGSTSTINTGEMLFNGGTVNILAGTITLANRTTRASASALGVLSFDSGTVDATTIIMDTNLSGGTAPNATISVGGGTLSIGSGGMSMVNNLGAAGTGTLIVTNGGTVYCSNNIFKTAASGVATIWLSNANLTMTSTTGTIGVSNTLPIDNFDITNSTLTLPASAAATVVVTSFNPDTASTSTINIGALPSITSYPYQSPLIVYTTAGGNVSLGGNTNLNLLLGTLPGTFTGFLSNNTGNLSIDLVITNGPSVKAIEWGGAVNNLWDTNSLNWTNNGFAVKYNDLVLVTFDDNGQTNIVNIKATCKPAALTINNSVDNYTFNGVGNLGDPAGSLLGLLKEGTASLTLSESGGDSFSGGITNNGGTLILDDANSAISGGLTIAGGATVQIGNNDANGALPSGPLNDQGTLIFDQTGNVVVSTVIGPAGDGALIQSGSGTLTLSAVNTYNGNTTVSNGTLALTGSGSISASQSVLVTNATLDVSGLTAATTLTSLSLGNATLNLSVGYLATNLTATSLALGGAVNTINVRSLPPIAYYPATVNLLQCGGSFSGFNFVLGSLPSASPAYAGASLALSADGTAVLLTLTNGPIGTRSSVTWGGADYVNTVNTNWTDSQNWVSPGVPSAAEKVTFNDTAESTSGSPFNAPGDGIGGVVNPPAINNIVDASLTNAGLTYANDSTGYQNTQIAFGKTLTLNGSLAVDGAGRSHDSRVERCVASQQSRQ